MIRVILSHAGPTPGRRAAAAREMSIVMRPGRYRETLRFGCFYMSVTRAHNLSSPGPPAACPPDRPAGRAVAPRRLGILAGVWRRTL
jgi:hypothetical protein